MRMGHSHWGTTGVAKFISFATTPSIGIGKLDQNWLTPNPEVYHYINMILFNSNVYIVLYYIIYFFPRGK